MTHVRTILLPLLTLALFTAPAFAQHGQHHGPPSQRGMMMSSDSMPGPMMGPMMGMMQMMRGMHKQMIQNPMHRSRMMIFMLPALADTLGLSEQRRSRLQELKSKAMNQRQEYRQQMREARKKFRDLFEEGQPSPKQVRQPMMAMAERRVDQQTTLYRIARQMRQVLTAEQRQLLDNLTPRQRMRQMMSTMPMMDMMRMMRSIHGGMMGGGMMQMMQNMPMQHGGKMKPGGMPNMPRQNDSQNR